MHKLLNLLKANASGKPLRNDAAQDGAHIYLYDVIDPYFGVSAEGLKEPLAAAAGKTVHLHINSPGGDVFESIAMASMLAAHDGDVIVHIDGVAASAATRVALAGKEVRIADSGLLMIHNSWTMAWGNAEDIRKTADLLDKIDAGIAADYARKTGKPIDEISALMNAETWFSAQEAKDIGLVDHIDTTTQASNKWDLSAYANAPKPDNSIADMRASNERRLKLLQIT